MLSPIWSHMLNFWRLELIKNYKFSTEQVTLIGGKESGNEIGKIARVLGYCYNVYDEYGDKTFIGYFGDDHGFSLNKTDEN